MLNLLEKNNTDEGKAAVAKLHRLVDDEIRDNSIRVKKALAGIDPKLGSRWEEVLTVAEKFNHAVGVLEIQVGVDYSSLLSDLKGAFQDFAAMFNTVWLELVEWGKRAQLFQSMCEGCR